jgi:hypothetical protein
MSNQDYSRVVFAFLLAIQSERRSGGMLIASARGSPRNMRRSVVARSDDARTGGGPSLPRVFALSWFRRSL